MNQILRALDADDLDDIDEEAVERMLNTAADRGCIDVEDAERVTNTVRGMEGARFPGPQLKQLSESVIEAFRGEERGDDVDVFTVTDTDGSVVLELEPGDAIEVTFQNTIAGREDTVQGVIERIRPGAEGGDLVFTDGTRIVIGDDSAFARRRGEVIIDGRRRGHIRESVDQAIRPLFGDAAERENKRSRWRLLQERTNEEVRELGLGPGALPERDEDDDA